MLDINACAPRYGGPLAGPNRRLHESSRKIAQRRVPAKPSRVADIEKPDPSESETDSKPLFYSVRTTPVDLKGDPIVLRKDPSKEKKQRYLKVDRELQRTTILSVDGGGLRGLIPAKLLECLEDCIKAEIVANRETLTINKASDPSFKEIPTDREDFYIHLADYFDVVAGTSTGGILATFLATKGAEIGKSPLAGEFKALLDGLPKDQKFAGLYPNEWREQYSDEVLQRGTAKSVQAVFLTRARKIFPQPGPPTDGVWGWFKGTYDGILDKGKKITSLVKPKYPADGIQDTVKMILGDMKLNDSRIATSLVAQAFELDFNRPFTFWFNKQVGEAGYATLNRALTVEESQIKAGEKGRLESPTVKTVVAGKDKTFVYEPDFAFFEGVKIDLQQVVRATSAAPTFFPAVEVKLDYEPKQGAVKSVEAVRQMCDGGVCANSPTMIAIAFALVALRKNSQAIRLQDTATLSLGTGQSVSSTKLRDLNAGVFQWVVQDSGRLIDILMESPAQIQTALGEYLLYKAAGLHELQFLRIQTTSISMEGAQQGAGAAPEQVLSSSRLPSQVLKSMDDANAIWDLMELGANSIIEHSNIIQQFVRHNLFPLPAQTTSTGQSSSLEANSA